MGKELNRLGRIKNRIKSTEKSIKAQNEETKVRITTCKKEVNNTFDALMKNIEKKTKDFEKQLNHNKDDVGSKIDLIESIKKVEAQSNVSALSETFDNIKKHLDESIVSEGDLDALVQKHSILSAEVCRAFCEKLVNALKILSEEKTLHWQYLIFVSFFLLLALWRMPGEKVEVGLCFFQQRIPHAKWIFQKLELGPYE